MMEKYNPLEKHELGIMVSRVFSYIQIVLMFVALYFAIFGPKDIEDKDEKAVSKSEKAATAEKISSYTDSRDGKKYRTVKIGTQTWLAENLNYVAEGSKCYKDDASNCKKYGRMYTQAEAMKACPEGWHLPSHEEWKALVNFVGGNEIAGEKLKAKNGWKEDGNGTDKYGFSALPSIYDGPGGDGKSVGNWWGASENNGGSGTIWIYYYTMKYGVSEMSMSQVGKGAKIRFYVRCVQANAEGSGNAKNTTNKPSLPSDLSGDAKNVNLKDVIAELEQDAGIALYKQDYKSHDGKFFSFKRTMGKNRDGNAETIWTATTKMDIGNCPARSIWKVYMECSEDHCWSDKKIPVECKFITPKMIMEFDINQ